MLFFSAIYSLPPLGPRPDKFTGVDRTPKEEIAFIRAQAPKAKYILSVCSGALQLALAGVLTGKRATTNKAFYRVITVRRHNLHLTGFSQPRFRRQPRVRRTLNGYQKRAGSSTEMCGLPPVLPQVRILLQFLKITQFKAILGSDMALAFLEHLAGAKLARQIRSIVEIPEMASDDDQFAHWHGLV